MRALVALLLGYYLGAKDGPERLSKLAQSARDIVNSSEFQGLRSNLGALTEQLLEQLQQNIAPHGSGATSTGDLWKAISESAEIHELLAQAWDSLGSGWPQLDSARVHYAAVVQAWRRPDRVFARRAAVARRRLRDLTSSASPRG